MRPAARALPKVYISGPMSGVQDLNFPAFNETAAKVRALGHEVVNPAELGEHAEWVWADYLKRDLTMMFDCDAILMLPDWGLSKGANLEHTVAVRLGIRVVTLADIEREHLSRVYGGGQS